MTKAKGYAATSAKSPLAPFSFERRDPRPDDVEIEILYCGVCHSDIHQVRDEWGSSLFPMVPGHEIVGKVRRVGANVKNFKPGDYAGVGCMVDSCLDCESCHEGLEQFCENGFVGTYNAVERDGKTPTFGGYSDSIVVKEKFTLHIPRNLAEKNLAAVAPLLCAGITTFSPLRHWNVKAGQKVGIIGLGGLGHMGVKFARAFGAKVVAITHSPGKREEALRLGAHEVLVSKNEAEMRAHAESFHFLLNTVSAPHEITDYLNLLKRDGAMVLVGVPEKAPPLHAFGLIMKRRKIGGSLIGGIRETQEMLDYCGQHEIFSDIEMIPINKVNEAYERVIRSDVKYRFVIDCKSI